MNNITKIFLLCFLLLLFNSVAFAYLDISFNKTSFAVGEEVNMIITTDEQGDLQPQQLNLLFKQLDNLGSSQSSSYQNINGVVSQTKSWIYQVTARQKGDITIPAIRLGNSISKKILLKVKKDSSQQSPTGVNNFLLLGSVDNKKPYVQSEIIYSFKLLYRRGQKILRGQIDQLNIPGIKVKTIVKEKRYQMPYKGNSYSVIEWRYAFIPQRSGDINIPKLSFSGTVQTNQGRRSIRLFTDAIKLQVKAQPSSWPANYEWLPAKSLSIWEKWNPSVNRWVVNNRYSREVQISAKGVEAKQINTIGVNVNAKNVSIYPSSPKRSDKVSGDGHQASIINRVDYVAQSEGKFVLEEIKIPWWDVINDELEYASLSAREIDIVLDVNASVAQTKKPMLIDSEKDSKNNNDKVNDISDILDNQQTSDSKTIITTENHWFVIDQNNFLWFILLWFVSILLPVLWLYFHFKKNHNNVVEKPELDNEYSLNKGLNELKRVLQKETNWQVLYDEILSFKRFYFAKIPQQLKQQWLAEIQLLNQIIFKEQSLPTDKQLLTLIQLIKNTEKIMEKNNSYLPNLYPK